MHARTVQWLSMGFSIVLGFGAYSSLSSLFIQGFPALFSHSGLTSAIRARADDALGTSWPSMRLDLKPGDDALQPGLSSAISDGNPTVIVYLFSQTAPKFAAFSDILALLAVWKEWQEAPMMGTS